MKIGDVVWLRGDPEVKLTVASLKWGESGVTDAECCWFDAGLRIRSAFFPVDMLAHKAFKESFGFVSNALSIQDD